MVKEKYPDVEAVSSGAINSTYQKNRVENVCQRLGLTSLAPLWELNQVMLLEDMVKNEMNAILIRVCSCGLEEKHLGKSIIELQPFLLAISENHGVHCCREGGEFESIVLDCFIFKKNINFGFGKIVENDKPFSFVGKIIFRKVQIVENLNIILSKIKKNISY